MVTRTRKLYHLPAPSGAPGDFLCGDDYKHKNIIHSIDDNIHIFMQNAHKEICVGCLIQYIKREISNDNRAAKRKADKPTT